MPSGVPFDDEQKGRLLRLVAEKGMHPATAAESIGFTWGTVKDHLNEDVLFRDAFVEAQEIALARIEDKLYDEALHGNLGAIKMFLTNRAPRGRWVDERDRGAGGRGGLGDPSIVLAGVREMLTSPEGGTAVIDRLVAVPLPGAIEATATDHG